MPDIMLAIKPWWAQLIYSKKKTIEVRRVLPKRLDPGDTIYLYESAPVSMVTGTVGFLSIRRAEKNTFWEINGHRTCLPLVQFIGYFYGYVNVGAIWLDSPFRWKSPRKIETFGIKKAPQNFCYLKEAK